MKEGGEEMYKKLIIILTMLLTSITLLAETNPLNEYLGEEDFKAGKEKFEKDKNIFKESVVNIDAIIKEVKDAESRVKATFSVVATVKKDNKWGAVIYFNNPKSSSKERLVIIGDIAKRVDGYLYYLVPYEKGLRVKDLRTGNFYNIEIKGR
jgi:hypothetical protein